MDSSSKSRIPFVYNGQTVYEWEQTLEEILVYIKAPPFILPENREKLKKQGKIVPKLEVKISPRHVSVGLQGITPYLDEDLSMPIKASESLWELDETEKEIVLTLEKTIRGVTWPSVFVGHKPLDPFEAENARKKLLRERFQEENSGFDFSDAEISGNVPDPREFMGGIKKN